MNRYSVPYAETRLPAITTLPIVMSVTAAAVMFALIMVGLVMLRPVLPVDETRYFAIAWEMWNGGSAIVPHLNGQPYSDKPPLLFWAIDVAWKLFGTDSSIGRFVAPSFALVCVYLTARLWRRLWPQEQSVAPMAAWILATSGTFLLYGSLTTFDAMLTAAALLAILGILRARRECTRSNWLAVGAALGFGVLAKGPVILIHVLPVALLMPVWAAKETRPPLRDWYRGIGLAVLIALAIVSIWLIPALMKGGSEYRYDILWRQHGGRLVESFAHRQPVWFYLAILPLFAWPWAWSRNVLSALTRKRIVSNEGLRFCMTWMLGSLFLFSLVSGKQVHYLLPEECALALVVAYVIYARTPDLGAAGSSRPLIALIIPVGLFLCILATKSDWLAPSLAEKGLEVPWASVIAAGVILALLASVVLWKQVGIAGWLLLAPATLLMVHVSISPVLNRVYDASIIGERLADHEISGVGLVRDEYRGEFTFAGRLTGPVAELADDQAVIRWSCTHPGGVIVSRHPFAASGYAPLGTYNFRGRTYQLLEVSGSACMPHGEFVTSP